MKSVVDRLAGPCIALAVGVALLLLGYEETGLIAIGGALGILLPQKASGLLPAPRKH